MSAGLDSPNYTQVPNTLFDLMPQMSEAELRCTLLLVRKIIGYHKDGPEPISLTQFEKETGMSRQGVINGIESAIKRGFVQEAGTGKRGTKLYTLNINDLSTSLIGQENNQSTKKTSRKRNQSTKLTRTSQRSRPELVNEVDTQKKDSKENIQKKDSDPDGSGEMPSGVPKSPNIAPTSQQAMFEAICRVWGYPIGSLTPSRKTDIGKVASELVAAHADPAMIPHFKIWLDKKAKTEQWKSYTVNAMKKYWPDYAAVIAPPPPPVVHKIPDGWCEPDAQFERTMAWYKDNPPEDLPEVRAAMERRQKLQGGES